MDSVKITWEQEGYEGRRESAVNYSPAAAADYKPRKAAEPGVSNVQIVPVDIWQRRH